MQGMLAYQVPLLNKIFEALRLSICNRSIVLSHEWHCIFQILGLIIFSGYKALNHNLIKDMLNLNLV